MRAEYDVKQIIKNHNMEKGGKAQKYIDSEVLRLSDPRTPKDTGELINSGVRATKIGSGKVVYDAKHAKKMWQGDYKFEGAPTRGSYWAIHAMNDGGTKSILEGLKDLL